ncbi:MAG: hypothetical protein KGH60_04295 [Candidatus Micrarchaeota archaeon]|nr:hypothetical protein [Candidatus Micrarchaeota archaeon]
MERRTTVLLDKDVYEALVKESLNEYKTGKAISRVMNDILRKALMNRANLTRLLHAKKLAKVTNKEFEGFRSELSKAAMS